MKRIFILFLCFIALKNTAQVFNNYSGYPIPLNISQTTIIPITVSGLPNTINAGFGLKKIKLGITHSSDQDLEVKLKAPDNTEILLFTSVGGLNGADFRNTSIQNDGIYYIEQGTPPFNGNYIPLEDINKVNNNQNPNATWFLLVTDTYPFANAGFVDSVQLEFGSNPSAFPQHIFVCPTCNCPPGITDCDLLPDMTSSELVIVNDQIETPGSILIGNGTPNIGLGPLEVRPVDSCFCGLTQVPCTQTTCPGNIPVSQRLHQRIYHKHTNNDTLSFYDVSAGQMSYHPNHGHIHVDDWADFTLREKTNDPDPRNWPIIGTSVKQSYCLINLSSCDGYPGACKDNLGLILDQQSQFVNYGLGYFSGCGRFQGIYPGKLDIYSSGLNAPINLSSVCNGDYYIVSITDPDSVFQDQDYSNNIVAVPIQLTQQVPASTANFMTTFNNPQAVVNATGLLAGATYLWDFGDGSPYQSVNPASHTYTANGTYIISLWVNTPCGDRFKYDTIVISGIVPTPLGVNISETQLFLHIAPNPSKGNIILTYQMSMTGDVEVNLIQLTGERKLLYKGYSDIGLQKMNLDLNAFVFNNGLYILEFKTATEQRTQKISIMK